MVRLALWKRRLRFRVKRLATARASAHHGGTVTHREATRVHKWERLADKAQAEVTQRAHASAQHKPSVRARCVAHAKAYAGVTEHPPGSNGGGLIDIWERALGFGHVAWCGIFAANMLAWAGVRGVTGRLAGVALIEDDARAHAGPFRGWTLDPRGVLPGDLAVLFGRGVHVEIVEKVVGNVVYTIGGNTSGGPGGSQSNGGGVFRRQRALSDVHGFALVNFPDFPG